MLWRLPFNRITSDPPMSKEAQDAFPFLATEFEDLQDVLLEPFSRHDRAALVQQRSHRRFQLALAAGVGLTTVFGAVQAATDATWAGIVLTVFGLASAGISNRQRQRGSLARYLRERAKAEELRSLYFSYLSATGPASRAALEQAVAAISHPLPGKVR